MRLCTRSAIPEPPHVSVMAAEQNVQCFLLLTAHRITKRNPSRPSPLASSLAGSAQSMSSLEDDGPGPPKPPAQPATDQLPRALLLTTIGPGSGAHQACRPSRPASRPALSKRSVRASCACTRLSWTHYRPAFRPAFRLALTAGSGRALGRGSSSSRAEGGRAEVAALTAPRHTAAAAHTPHRSHHLRLDPVRNRYRWHLEKIATQMPAMSRQLVITSGRPPSPPGCPGAWQGRPAGRT